MHVSEMDYEMEYFKKEYNQTPIEFLESNGLLHDKLLAAHCIHLSEHDIELISEYHVKVAHCVGSNMKAGKGIAPLKELYENNVCVGLGSDGASSGNTLDILTKLPLIARAHKTKNHDRALFPAKTILQLATIQGAKALGTDEYTGSIEVSKKTDLVLFETKSVNMFPIFDQYSTIVYSANQSNVNYVWINGKNVVANKKLVHVDLETIKSKLNKQMEEFSKIALQLIKE